jgi:hypothetical protein
MSARQTFISTEDAERSFLLGTLTGFGGDGIANQRLEHDLYVMAP